MRTRTLSTYDLVLYSVVANKRERDHDRPSDDPVKNWLTILGPREAAPSKPAKATGGTNSSLWLLCVLVTLIWLLGIWKLGELVRLAISVLA